MSLPTATFYARSISLALPTLPRHTPMRVLSVHRRVVNLADAENNLLALVAPEVGEGPFHMVLAQTPDFSFARAGMAGIMHGRTLTLANHHFDATRATRWQPRLPQTPLPTAIWPQLETCINTQPRFRQRGQQLDAATAARMAQGLAALQAHDFAAGVALLMGLGPGLTPAGDDVLLGALARAHMTAAPWLHALAAQVTAQAAATTLLSRAWLLHAAAGRFDARWHALHAGLLAADTAALCAAVQAILAVGASSGPQALAGFLV